jgi:hypothetical protein
MNYTGTIIEESLWDKSVLNEVKIVRTKVEPVTKKHQTPWLTKWTLHAVEVSENAAETIAENLSHALEPNYWYADFKNDQYHYIIYRDKLFKVDLSNPTLYQEAKQYGLSLGIPPYQVDFTPEN